MPNDKIYPYPISADSLPGDEQRIDYNTCLKSIPGSEIKSLEAMEYITYFCGLDCYDRWIKQQKTNVSPRA